MLSCVESLLLVKEKEVVSRFTDQNEMKTLDLSTSASEVDQVRTKAKTDPDLPTFPLVPPGFFNDLSLWSLSSDWSIRDLFPGLILVTLFWGVWPTGCWLLLTHHIW